MPTTREDLEVRGVDRTDAAFRSIQGNLRGLDRSLGQVRNVLGSVLGAGGFGLLVTRSLDAADHVNDLSNSLNASAEFLSRMDHVARQNGSSLDAVADALRSSRNAAVEAVDGNKKLIDSFQRLGIAPRDFIELSADEQFLALTRGLEGLTNASQRQEVAQDLLKGSAGEMLQVMAEGEEGIRRLWEESDRLGKTLSDDVVKAADEANDAIGRLKSTAEGFFQRMAGNLAMGALQWARWLGGGPEMAKELGEVMLELEKAQKRFVSLDTQLSNVPAETLQRDASAQRLKQLTDEAQAQVVELLRRKRALEAELFAPPKDAADGFVEGAWKEVEEAKKIIAALEEQAATFGMTREEISLYKLELAGATEEQLAHARALVDEVGILTDVEEAAKKQREEIEARRKELERNTKADADLIAELEREFAALSMTERAQAELAAVTRLSADATEEQKLRTRELAGALFDAQKQMEEAEEAAERQKEIVRDLGLTFTSAFENAVVEGDSLRDVLKGIEQDLLRLLARKLVTEPFANFFAGLFEGGGSGGGGFNPLALIGSLFSTGSGGSMALGQSAAGYGSAYGFGFQHGGEFAVPGVGALDSRLVSFWATPGERVRVTPPGEHGGGSGAVNVTNHFHITTPSGDIPMQAQEEIAAKVGTAMMRAMRRNR